MVWSGTFAIFMFSGRPLVGLFLLATWLDVLVNIVNGHTLYMIFMHTAVSRENMFMMFAVCLLFSMFHHPTTQDGFILCLQANNIMVSTFLLHLHNKAKIRKTL